MASCQDCQKEITGAPHPTYYNGQVCDPCYRQGAACGDCGVAMSVDDLDGDGRCDRCHGRKYDDCEDCHESVPRGGLKNGRCDDCRAD